MPVAPIPNDTCCWLDHEPSVVSESPVQVSADLAPPIPITTSFSLILSVVTVGLPVVEIAVVLPFLGSASFPTFGATSHNAHAFAVVVATKLIVRLSLVVKAVLIFAYQSEFSGCALATLPSRILLRYQIFPTESVAERGTFAVAPLALSVARQSTPVLPIAMLLAGTI